MGRSLSVRSGYLSRQDSPRCGPPRGPSPEIVALQVYGLGSGAPRAPANTVRVCFLFFLSFFTLSAAARFSSRVKGTRTPRGIISLSVRLCRPRSVFFFVSNGFIYFYVFFPFATIYLSLSCGIFVMVELSRCFLAPPWRRLFFYS